MAYIHSCALKMEYPAKIRGSILIPAIVLLLLGNMLIAASLQQTGNLSRISTAFERKVDLQTAMRNTLLKAYSQLRLLDAAAPDFNENLVHTRLCGAHGIRDSEGIVSECAASLLVPPRWRPENAEEDVFVNAQVLVNAYAEDSAGNKITTRVLFSKSPAGTVRIEGTDFIY